MSTKDVLKGYPDGTFKPDAQITRAELAAIVTRYDQQAWAGQAVNFNDVAPDHWAAGNITRASQNGWVTGYPDGSFKPNQAITRAETVTMVNRMLERYADELYIAAYPTVVKQYSDISGHWAFYQMHEASNSHYYQRNVDKTETWSNVVDK